MSANFVDYVNLRKIVALFLFLDIYILVHISLNFNSPVWSTIYYYCIWEVFKFDIYIHLVKAIRNVLRDAVPPA